ncbi:MAG: tRNA (guanosine(37)-N1)-methyltransferase TrmD [Acidobacteriota bacterium]
MHFDILTLFPDIVDGYLAASTVGRAKKHGIITTQSWNMRDFTSDTHKTVDDTPYGGGAGMVMKIEPIDCALQALTHQLPPVTPNKRRVVVVSARGKQFTQQTAHTYARLDQLILICGRYEGIDQRVADHLADEEVSIGPYVLAGGELPALAILEATARLVPGVLGNERSLALESHNEPGFIESPQYTKPEEYNGWKVPEVLLSGNHEEIRKWREEHSAPKGHKPPHNTIM